MHCGKLINFGDCRTFAVLVVWYSIGQASAFTECSVPLILYLFLLLQELPSWRARPRTFMKPTFGLCCGVFVLFLRFARTNVCALNFDCDFTESPGYSWAQHDIASKFRLKSGHCRCSWSGLREYWHPVSYGHQVLYSLYVWLAVTLMLWRESEI